MPGWAGSRTPKAPRSGARRCRFCRVPIKTGAPARSFRAVKLGHRTSLSRRGPAWEDWNSGKTAFEGPMPKGAVARKSPAAGRAAGRWCSLV